MEWLLGAYIALFILATALEVRDRRKSKQEQKTSAKVAADRLRKAERR